jgi:hypothetical protein
MTGPTVVVLVVVGAFVLWGLVTLARLLIASWANERVLAAGRCPHCYAELYTITEPRRIGEPGLSVEVWEPVRKCSASMVERTKWKRKASTKAS